MRFRFSRDPVSLLFGLLALSLVSKQIYGQTKRRIKIKFDMTCLYAREIENYIFTFGVYTCIYYIFFSCIQFILYTILKVWCTKLSRITICFLCSFCNNLSFNIKFTNTFVNAKSVSYLFVYCFTSFSVVLLVLLWRRGATINFEQHTTRVKIRWTLNYIWNCTTSII